MGRGILVHVALLIAAAVASVLVWTRDKKPAVSLGDITIWNARAADVQRVAYESKGRKVSLEARKDALGVWFFGRSETPVTPSLAPDGGAPPAPRTAAFVSVGAAGKLAEALAPLRALREIGKIGDDRAAEFGLTQPDGSLTATIDGKERRLTVGARTAGGGDRYVRDDASGVVYVVRGEVTRDLESGESALSERETHEFKDADVLRVRISARGKTREILRRGPDNKRSWADPADPDKDDETAANWIAKVERLKPAEYLADPPATPETILRIDYDAKGAKGAFLELAKVPGAADKPDFVIRTERTRLWAKVSGPGADVEQDLSSVLK